MSVFLTKATHCNYSKYRNINNKNQSPSYFVVEIGQHSRHIPRAVLAIPPSPPIGQYRRAPCFIVRAFPSLDLGRAHVARPFFLVSWRNNLAFRGGETCHDRRFGCKPPCRSGGHLKGIKGRVAQRESTSLTSKGSLVQSQSRPPFLLFPIPSIKDKAPL